MRRTLWLLVGLLAGLASACGSTLDSCAAANGTCLPHNSPSCVTVRSDGTNPCEDPSKSCCLRNDGGIR